MTTTMEKRAKDGKLGVHCDDHGLRSRKGERLKERIGA